MLNIRKSTMKPLLIIAALFFIFTGCSQQQSKEIVVFLPSADNPFWIEVRRGIESSTSQLGKEHKITILASGDLDAASQVEQLSNVLSRRQADAIVIGIANNRSPAPIIAKYNSANIPVVMIDTKLDDEAALETGASYNAFVGSDNYLGGIKAAEEMIKMLSKGKRVLLIKGNYIHQSAIDRAEGFISGCKDSLTILERDGEWSRTRASEITVSIMSREPVGGIFASNDDMALGVVAALKNLQLRKQDLPIVIGFDATNAGVEAIKDGFMHASVRQDPVAMGKTGVSLAIDLLEGKTVKRETLIPVEIIKN